MRMASCQEGQVSFQGGGSDTLVHTGACMRDSGVPACAGTCMHHIGLCGHGRERAVKALGAKWGYLKGLYR